jgi:hypothetical protein
VGDGNDESEMLFLLFAVPCRGGGRVPVVDAYLERDGQSDTDLFAVEAC